MKYQSRNSTEFSSLILLYILQLRAKLVQSDSRLELQRDIVMYIIAIKGVCTAHQRRSDVWKRQTNGPRRFKFGLRVF